MDQSKKESIEQLASLEHLDTALQVVSIRGWAALLFFVLLAVFAIAWSMLGTIPLTVSGKCIAFDPEASFRIRSSVPGIVRSVRVSGGDLVKKGDLLIVIDNQELLHRLEDQRMKVALIQKEAENGPEAFKEKLSQEQIALRVLQDQVRSLSVISPVDAVVSWIDVTWGDTIAPDQIMLWLQAPFTPDTLKILAFLPLYAGQQIHPGMLVQTGIDTINRNAYGMIRGVVSQVQPYPIAPSDYYMQKIPSQPLRDYLVEGSLPSILVVIEPLKNPHTPSGLQWTTPMGPPFAVPPGMLGEARITLGEIKPISYVFPVLQMEKKHESPK